MGVLSSSAKPRCAKFAPWSAERDSAAARTVPYIPWVKKLYSSGALSRNPATIDIGTTGGDYGVNVLLILGCLK